jgi:hypothetical protein
MSGVKCSAITSSFTKKEKEKEKKKPTIKNNNILNNN